VNVLSLFDGMSCGQLALKKASIPIGTYHASEIDKYAKTVTMANFPNTVQLGDVTKVNASDLPEIDLLIGGSPCQGFSFAGKRMNFDDPRSALFFEFVRLLRELKPTYFLLENVRMAKVHQDIISDYLGVQPIQINSDLVSAQNRRRLYWTNIQVDGLPKDKGITFGDVKEHGAADNHYYSPAALNWISRHEIRKNKKLRVWADGDKMQMLEASMHKKYSSQRFFGIQDVKGLRYVTPLECERAQTVPDGYTDYVSNTQRYRMLGNGWTVDVIAWFFGFLGNPPIQSFPTRELGKDSTEDLDVFN
jgi:site-specific DNA-cytosine methylase